MLTTILNSPEAQKNLARPRPELLEFIRLHSTTSNQAICDSQEMYDANATFDTTNEHAQAQPRAEALAEQMQQARTSFLQVAP
jgi:hypothetical protein